MPPWAAGERYYRAYKMHFGLPDLVNFGLEVDGWFSSPCLAEHTGKCPVCALANKAKALGTRNDDLNLLNLQKNIRAKQQYVANVVDMGNKDQGVQLLTFGKKVFEDLQAIFARKGNVTHPVTGFNLVVSKREIPNQRWFDYSVSIDEREDISADWDTFKTQLQNLNAFPTLPDYAEIQAKIDSIELLPPNAVLTTSAPQRDQSRATTPENTPSLEDLDRELDAMSV